MSTDYNSKLISKLYNTTDTEEIKEILQEMEEIKDPIFLEPIFDAYIKSKKTAISHYFLSALKEFDDKESLNIAIRIFNLEKGKVSDINWLFPVFTKHNFFHPQLIEVAKAFLIDFSEKGKTSEGIQTEFELEFIFNFLDKSGELKSLDEQIIKIIFNDHVNQAYISLSIYKFLRLDSNKGFQYMVDNYEKIKNTQIEILIAKEITLYKWKGDRVNLLKSLIKEKGSNRAKEVISEQEKKEMTEEKSERENDYPFVLVVSGISELRKSINSVAQVKEELGMNIFQPNEFLLVHQKIVKDKQSFRVFCTDFRSYINDLSTNLKHTYDEASVKKLLPDSDPRDYGKPFNNLFLYLHSKKIKVDPTLFGLKKLNKFVGILGAHSEAAKQLVELLESYGIGQAYTKGQWNELQRFVFEEYKNSLEKFLNSLQQQVSKEKEKEITS